MTIKLSRRNVSALGITRISLATTALTFGLMACQPNPKNDNDKQLAELSAKLDKLDHKLDALAGQARAPAQAAPKRPTPGQLYNVALAPTDAYRGGAKAKVTVVLASEFACPYCSQLALEVDKLLGAFPDEDLKVVAKDFVVHPDVATLPAHAVCAANRQGKYGEFEQALWKGAWGDKRLNREALSQKGLDTIASELGLDLARFHKDMEGDCPAQVAKSHREMAMLGVNGTPAVYINGSYYAGARSFEALKAAVEAERSKVDEQLAKGVALDGYYESLIAKGKKTI